MQVYCLVWGLFFSEVAHRLYWSVKSYNGLGREDGLPRVLFFSVNVFKNPKLMDSGLFPLSDWPLPYPLPLPPVLGPYWSTGEADDMSNDLRLARPGIRVRKRNYLIGALVDALCSRTRSAAERIHRQMT